MSTATVHGSFELHARLGLDCRLVPSRYVKGGHLEDLRKKTIPDDEGISLRTITNGVFIHINIKLAQF